jgi:hypothetical protein
MLMRLARSSNYPAPRICEIHVGSEERQSRPEIVSEFARLTGIAVTVAQGRGHDLGKDYIGPLLDNLADTQKLSGLF